MLLQMRRTGRALALCLRLCLHTSSAAGGNSRGVSVESAAKLGVSFSPAGLMTPFHMGASHQLREYGIITSHTALAGSSGGALAAVTSALNIGQHEALEACCRIARRCRDEGTALTLRKALDDVLNELLSETTHAELNGREAKCLVAYTEVLPRVSSRYITEFHNKQDLIDVLRASCNIPFYFNGMFPCVKVRDGYGVDGFFSVEVYRFGCPPTGATEREIIVCPYPLSKVGIDADLLRRNSQVVSVEESSAGQPNIQFEYEFITPDLLQKEKWPFSFSELLLLSLGPPTKTSSKLKKEAQEKLEDSSPNETSEIDNSIFSKAKRILDWSTYYPTNGDSATKGSVFSMESMRSAWDDSVGGMWPKQATDEEIRDKYQQLFDAGAEAAKVWYADYQKRNPVDS